jgi:ribonucleoside-diphosphate reductase alpha chain
MPTDRISVVEKFELTWYNDELKSSDIVTGFIILGFHDDGVLGELFLNIGKEGGLIRGFGDAFATMFSIALQHGAPLETLLDKLKFAKFDPSGFTNREERRQATSVLDLVAHIIEDVCSRGIFGIAESYHGGLCGTKAIRVTGLQKDT